ncbi:MAG: hypothetical protein QFX34_00375 [Candidatus Verstraetearchaeota archaeon]|nr:hypothetical protein [Candidatus Verstraetearchaeota archaeon]
MDGDKNSMRGRYELGHEREQRYKMRFLVVIFLVLVAISFYATYNWLLALDENERPFMTMGVPTVVDAEAGSAVVIRLKSTCSEPLTVESVTLRVPGSGDVRATSLSCREIAPGELVQVTAFSPVPLPEKSYEVWLTINGKDYSIVARRNA